MKRPASDVAFSPSVKAVQAERGSRAAYARMEARGGFHPAVDDDLREFLARVDTAFLATASADGQPYVQHRGGPKGFIRALDDRTLAILDLAGNRQYVTTGNLRENDRYCLLLFDYLERQRIKVWGTAQAVPVSEQLLRAWGEVDRSARAEQVLLLTVTAWDANCPKHIPQKINVDEVEPVVAGLRARVAELEALLAARP